MKNFFWTTVFWLVVLCGFIGYLKWFNNDLWLRLTQYIVKQVTISGENISCDTWSQGMLLETTLFGKTSSGILASGNTNLMEKLDAISQQIKDINEKLDIQNSNAPDAVSVSLRTTKKTNVWIFPLNWGEYKQYTMSASDDILRDTLNLLLEKSAFSLVDTKLDNDGNLTITLQRVAGTSFGWSAMVEQVRTAIQKTATQFPQIKTVIITPEEILQP